MKNKIHPCLWFNGNAKEAADLYSAAFGNTQITANTGLVVMFEIEGKKMMGLNGGPMFTPNPSISFFMTFPNAEAINKAWEKLSDGGKALMPLDSYPWSDKYGWIQDRFGVSWQLMLSKPGTPEQPVIPALMFTGSNTGKADEAMKLYTSLFKNASIKDVSRYAAGEGDVEGSVKHGRFELEGHLFVAFDSSISHGFNFSEGISLVVNCDTQEEIDHFWNNLTADGGEESQCGWLKDRFGLSWQIIPSILGSLMGDPVKGQRTMQALMQMKKLDIAKLKNA